jgi:hypothetical protein
LQLFTNELINKDITDELKAIKHSLSAAFSIMGEQYARLCDESPETIKNINPKSPIIEFFNLCRIYRNLRHGDESTKGNENFQFVEYKNIDEEVEKVREFLEKNENINVMTLLGKFCSYYLPDHANEPKSLTVIAK